MARTQPHPIDLAEQDAWQTVLPRLPILSSVSAAWQGIYLEYHRQPAHETPDYFLPNHVVSIGLGYQANEFRVNGRLYKNFAIGNVGICPAYQSLTTQAYGSAEFILLAIDPTQLAHAVHECVNEDQIELVPRILGQDPFIYQMGLELKRELESWGADSRLYAESMATALAVHLLRRYVTKQPAIKSYSDGLPQSKLGEVIAYIQAHLHEPISLADLAAIAQMSPHYFASLFKQSTDLTPHQYLIQCRVERAKQLLQERKLPLIEVCHQVGFHSQSHFTQVFRKHTNVTPKVYRDLL